MCGALDRHGLQRDSVQQPGDGLTDLSLSRQERVRLHAVAPRRRPDDLTADRRWPGPPCRRGTAADPTRAGHARHRAAPFPGKGTREALAAKLSPDLTAVRGQLDDAILGAAGDGDDLAHPAASVRVAADVHEQVHAGGQAQQDWRRAVAEARHLPSRDGCNRLQEARDALQAAEIALIAPAATSA